MRTDPHQDHSPGWSVAGRRLIMGSSTLTDRFVAIAARALARRDRGWTGRDDVAFARWRAAAIEHERTAAAVEDAWGRLDQLRVLRTPDRSDAASAHPRSVDADLLRPRRLDAGEP